ncbi:MAG: hydrogenase expression/formation protein HypE [Anaeromusa sp.]|uniref:hydrogenase expression/formation protein HypE n=1 Tax=Anaeromusa sp. TaxID=1872520 RepID=UPI002B201CF1|nr:hydrogenase expression/formation protein HypE [Anaeromusa sp.]MEA4836061.1 hydrogenase expression/formation protein HypE [Anaeromusa sp.]
MKEEQIRMAHGAGGRLSRLLVEEVIRPYFGNEVLDVMHDAALLPQQEGRLAFTTDSYVVKPLFFPGGDIGRLAVCGTVNDLAVSGAKPLYLSMALVLEEGLPLSTLRRVLASMAQAAKEAEVLIVTGDTKVVERGAVDGLFINTAGVGVVPDGRDVTARRAREGQHILISGFLGDHALAVMAERHGLTLPEAVRSDCAPLAAMLQEVLDEVPQVAVLRDPTRGGLATALQEIAAQGSVSMELEEALLPVRQEVKATCDLLGFDPLYMANEGKCLLLVEPEDGERVLRILQKHAHGRDACRIGSVTKGIAGKVSIRTLVGGVRLLGQLEGDQLPRIC